MPFPKNRAQLLGAGYQFKDEAICKGCQARIEFWQSPRGKTLPMDPMEVDQSPAMVHFNTCPKADLFRKEKPSPGPLTPGQ